MMGETMDTTEMKFSYGSIAGALAKARAKFLPIKKTSVAKVSSPKGDYSYRYADLAEILDSVVPALSDNGLCVVFDCRLRDGLLIVEAMLLHESGEMLTATGFVPTPETNKPQDFGGRITYARRYALSCLLNIASEDDDDANASQGTPAAIERRAPTPPASRKPSADELEEKAYKIVREYGPEGAAEAWDKLSRERKKAAYDIACKNAHEADPAFVPPF